MPLYSRVITTPASSSLETIIRLKGDYITKLNVRFPPGPQGLLKVAFFYGNRQLWPEEADTYIQGDDEPIEWEEHYRVPERPMPLRVLTVNEDDTYEHSVYIRIATAYKTQLLAEQIVNAIAKRFGNFIKLLGRIIVGR